jgi:hypothetical protein
MSRLPNGYLRSNDMSLATIADQLNKAMEAKSKMKVGEIIDHPDGRKVKVLDGSFLRGGRVSNFWTFAPVDENGKLGKEEYGYGW